MRGKNFFGIFYWIPKALCEMNDSSINFTENFLLQKLFVGGGI